ncbi:unnamed protein product [Trichogramma brassicae]|uniref:H15 domain-containing protein n=1 Tax=Trichogramma brassicae TaxID=86971 RepID=A0A6H5IWN7_9HYME|nr:unnamed protein product [Trichogramma brassicae]
MSTDEVAKRVAETDTKKKPVAEMVMEALGNLMDKKGSSLQAIKKYMASFYAVDINRQAIFIRKFLKAAVEKGGTVEQVKGSGTSGRFRIPKDVVKAKEKKAAKESKKNAKKKVSQASDDDKSSSEEQEEEPAEKPGAPAKKAEKTLKKQPATANKSEKPTKKGPDAAKTAKKSEEKVTATKKVNKTATDDKKVVKKSTTAKKVKARRKLPSPRKQQSPRRPPKRRFLRKLRNLENHRLKRPRLQNRKKQPKQRIKMSISVPYNSPVN